MSPAGGEIVVSGLRSDEWINPFGATAEELLAGSLDEGGLLGKETRINGVIARELCQAYHQKKDRFQEATRLGTLMVREKFITAEQLSEALVYQKERSAPLGEILVQLKLCSAETLSQALEIQKAIRGEFEKLQAQKTESKTIWQRLLCYFK